MTLAAQRVWEAIYAAEFVYRLHEIRANDTEGRERGVRRALDMANAAAVIHQRRALVVEPSSRSRFRKRSR